MLSLGGDGLSCCGLVELFDFDSYEGEKPLEELAEACREQFESNLLHFNIVIFTKKEGQTGQEKFLKWLKSQDEHVVISRQTVNDNTKNKIKGYMWTVSKHFKRRLRQKINKLIREDGYTWRPTGTYYIA